MLQTPSKTTQTLLSPRIPRDNEHERYHPELEEELKECLFCLQRNAMMFDLEVDSDLIEQRIYERQALLCRYRYLLALVREDRAGLTAGVSVVPPGAWQSSQVRKG